MDLRIPRKVCDRQIMGALRWYRRSRGRPEDTLRRTVEKEMKGQGWTWGYLERCATDRSWEPSDGIAGAEADPKIP